MRYNRSKQIALLAIVLFLLLSLSGFSAISTLSGDTISFARTLTNPNNALGVFDGLTAASSGWKGSDTLTWTISDFSQTGTITSVKYAVRMSSTGFSNDVIAIQFSNDSGTTWFTNQSNIQPPGTLQTYGNFTVTKSFRTVTAINNMRVRLVYTQNAGPDGPTINLDGVVVYVTYTPPDTTKPNVTLNAPSDNARIAQKKLVLNFTPSDDRNLKNCTVYLNRTLNVSNKTVLINSNWNIINTTVGKDGSYFWNITCYDKSNNAGTASAGRVVNVDTTKPIVRLTSPPNNTLSMQSLNIFTYNVSDFSSISQCVLVVDDLVQDTDITISKDTPQTLQATLTNGYHPWYVNCTDQLGWRNQSSVFNLTVLVLTPTIVTDSNSYPQGENVTYTGENWQKNANVTLNLTLPNGTSRYYPMKALSDRTINLTRLIDYGFPAGTYIVNVSQNNDSHYNASTSFTVTARTVSLSTDKNTYIQGQHVLIKGLGFSRQGTINLTVFLPGSKKNTTMIPANASGGFLVSYPLNFTAKIGWYNVSASDLSYSNLNGTSSFNVSKRSPIISLNATHVSQNTTLGIVGTLFSEFSTIALQIYDIVSGSIGPGFPSLLLGNSTGGFKTSWYSNLTCSGEYVVLAQDQNQTSLQGNATFYLENMLSVNISNTVESVSANRVAPALSNVNRSDDTWQTTGLSGSVSDGYQEFAFFPQIPTNASFTSIRFTLEHHRTSTKVSSFQMYYVDQDANTMTLLAGAGCSGIPPDADGNTTCDLTSIIGQNVTKANNLRVRVNYSRSSGGGGDALVDAASTIYKYVGDPLGCFAFGSNPVAPSILNINTPSTIVLNAGTTKSVQCNFTVSDGNGASDIIGANVTFYHSTSSSSAASSNVTRYANSSCSIVSASINSKDYTCTAAILYYATNGTWTCNATGRSIDGVASTTQQFSIDPLYALNVTNTILHFGNLSGGSTSKNISEPVQNLGNQPLNLTVYGYGRSLGDGLAFRCPTQGIPVDQMRFAADISLLYSQKTSLSGDLQSVPIILSEQTNPDPSLSTNLTYWQTFIPNNISDQGLCNGTIVFHASAFR